MPVRSGYGPSVSDGATAHAADDVPPAVVVPPLDDADDGADGDDAPQPANAAPTPAPRTAGASRRRIFFVAMVFSHLTKLRSIDAHTFASKVPTAPQSANGELRNLEWSVTGTRHPCLFAVALVNDVSCRRG